MRLLTFALATSGLFVLYGCGGSDGGSKSSAASSLPVSSVVTSSVATSSTTTSSVTSSMPGVASSSVGSSTAGALSSLAESSLSASSDSSQAFSSLAPAYAKPTLGQDVPLTVDGRINWVDRSVHDPAVIKDGETFYIFGSHLAAAKSTDLINWEYFSVLSANDAVDESPLFNTYSSEIAEGIAWSDGYKGNWAADVIKAPNGKFWFYYNHCAQTEADGGCWNRSYLGLAEATSVEGPYVDKGVFLRSGYRNAGEFTTFPLDNGQITWSGSIDPNVIDPTVFYDKEGQLWMVYGSYSGGIFVLAMDETTGKPEAGQGYGKHVTGGGFAAVEGAWISYVPESGYYYMFTSIAGFAAADGYNIRISRSRNPDGPYLDAAGNDMVLARNNTLTLSKYGVKLMGGFNFVAEPGDTGSSWGYLSPGHNSAYNDPETRQNFLITHTRFPGQGEGHAVRVHELWLNKDGWLVASPQRYVPIDGENIVSLGDVQGDYRLINHQLDSNTVGHNSVYVSLRDDFSVTGEVNGSYALSSSNSRHITLVLDGVTYEGVVAWQWDNNAKEMLPSFSAVSASGVSVWGSKLPERTIDDTLEGIAASLELVDVAKDGAIDLPVRGTRAAVISWSSSNVNVIKTDGTVLRPAAGAGDQQVTLTATIAIGESSTTKAFTVLVPQRKAFNRLAQFDFEGNLNESLGNFSAGVTTGDRIWKTGTGGVTYVPGHTGTALNLDGSSGVLLPEGLITNHEYTVSMWVKPGAISQFSPAFYAAANEQMGADSNPFSDTWLSFLPQGWDGNTMLWGRVPSWFDGVTGLRIPENQWSHMAFSVKKGVATVYINGEQKFSGGNVGDLFSDGTGKFALGVNYWDLPFNGHIDDLKIYEASLTATEINALDIDNVDPTALLDMAADALTLGDVSAVTDNLVLPLTGPFASSVDWTSSNSAVLGIDGNSGVVTRPARGQSDVEVVLDAHIALGGQTVIKQISVTVKSLTPPEPVAVFNFEDDLTDSKGTFGAGSMVGNRVDVAGGTQTYAAGMIGKALTLDGNSGVLLPDNLIKDHSYTISLWLKPVADTQFSPAFFGWATNSSWISLVPRGPGAQNTMLWSGTAWFDGDFNAQIPSGSWSHLVAVMDGGALKTYVNGVLTNSMSNFPDVFTPATSTRFALGVNYWDTPFNGHVDQLKIFDFAIPQSVVTELFDEASQN
ncbi:MAG TPA: LamG-like jellyroll fold domain-containing protein [Cellvibrio sp.]|nr:LamG-like jellyroll fold domain-containing protein [Cellvibrio sp.]